MLRRICRVVSIEVYLLVVVTSARTEVVVVAYVGFLLVCALPRSLRDWKWRKGID
ncbi:hypothetical protein BDQ94DRAFT_152077 [Aspergillus welwitschiae]|uniref:Transmembrane protein n=1 Tax=Aspergillus welwitschiae TaxID=1341132 RepID=A0A3F3PNH8_9EURO|nr:hypothetical protein BDQ94DRAFT_152077 [Aspergillus welwitschiae]RDH28495.1 hypothetical protein BDQ94DRAFT_152077 [Aspergillus welwitschiae]